MNFGLIFDETSFTGSVKTTSDYARHPTGDH
jgi:hypothetical protein